MVFNKLRWYKKKNPAAVLYPKKKNTITSLYITSHKQYFLTLNETINRRTLRTVSIELSKLLKNKWKFKHVRKI